MRQRGNRKRVLGVVVSDKCNKTITVRVNRLVKHRQYGKYLNRSTRYHAHDEQNQAREGDHVEINYSLTVSSFTGTGTGNAPPPRSSDTLSSTIRVPDGHTVIVGGLLTETLADSSSHVPLLGDLPLIGWLFGSKSDSRSKVRLYAFIRPTILRDDRFEDLKYLSQESLEAAGVDDGLPPTRMQTIR